MSKQLIRHLSVFAAMAVGTGLLASTAGAATVTRTAAPAAVADKTQAVTTTTAESATRGILQPPVRPPVRPPTRS